MLAIDNRQLEYTAESIKNAFKHLGANGIESYTFSSNAIYYTQSGNILYTPSKAIKAIIPEFLNRVDFFTPKEILSWKSSDFNTYPKDIQNLMLQRQSEAGNTIDDSIFIKCPEASNLHGGFNWRDTLEGEIFWDNIIGNGQFHIFYDVYRKNQFNNPLKNNNNETKLQDKTSSICRGDEPKGCTISGKKGIATIASGHISFGRIIRGL